MGFLDDVFFGAVSTETVSPCDYRVEIFSGKYAYFENILGIKSFSSEKIELKIKKGYISVAGEGLCVKKYGLGDICIGGTVTEFKVVKS